MPKNLGLYNNDLSVPRKKDIDALTLRVDTNEDNIAMAESDIEGLQTDVGTLKTDVGQVKTALNSKQDAITGGASTITDNNLTANHALVSNGSGKVAVSTVTSTELGYLGGVTSNVQTQLNKKLETAPVTSVNGQTGAVTLGASDIGALPLTGGTMSGVIDMNGAKITNVGTPTAAQDAANKAYADSVKGVEVLTQSAEPTTQVTGDFWFQES